MAAMRLIPLEEERLLIFAAAELARRHRAAGLPLNHPEAVALICDALLDAARAGASYAEVEAAGRAALLPAHVMDGVATLLDEVRLEVLIGDGTRLIVLVRPLGDGLTDAIRPGEVRLGATGPSELVPGRERRTIAVRNGSTRVVRVSSHYPFDRVNPRLEFDRARATSFRLDIPAGASVRWAPGETLEVGLVRYGGRAGTQR
jgi:urease subunit gamma/beta